MQSKSSSTDLASIQALQDLRTRLRSTPVKPGGQNARKKMNLLRRIDTLELQRLLKDS